jgi:hypothetical protein
VCAACLKNSVRIFVEKIHKMGCFEGSGMPVRYIGGSVPIGDVGTLQKPKHSG